MTVFKNYFKIVWQHRFAISIYFVSFLALMMIFSTLNTTNSSTYQQVKVDIFIQDKAQTELSKGLSDYLTEKHNLVNVDEKEADDELFYGIISAIITMESDFDQTHEVFYKSSPQNMYGMAITNDVNQFMNKVEIYQNQKFSISDSIKFTREDLAQKSEVNLFQGQIIDEQTNSSMYFNFLNFVLLSQIILVVSTVMVAYNKVLIRKRNEVSPLKPSQLNLQLTLGHIIMGIFIWLVYMILFVILFSEAAQTQAVHLMMLNSFVFTISAVTLAVLLAKFVTNENALNAVTNVVALGSSFLSGAFVPQELLSPSTLNLSKILPSYYYISNNNAVEVNPHFSTIQPNLLIMIGFILVFVLLTMFVKKKGQN